MEEAWLKWLLENHPPHYKAATNSIAWAAEWREKETAAANARADAAQAELAGVLSNVECDDSFNEERLQKLRDENQKLRDDMLDINEYWNGNHASMPDALQHVLDVTEKWLLSYNPGAAKGEE